MRTHIVSLQEVRKNQFVVSFLCDFCGLTCCERKSHFDRKQRHYCSMSCYSEDRKLWPPEQGMRWSGGVSSTEAHRRWKRKNPERMRHLRSARYAREKGADGSHTLEEWTALKLKFGGRCAYCKNHEKLTKDHIIPLSKGGSNYIENIQPLCRSCNSRKWAKVNPELLNQ